MTSLITNSSAMNALSALRNVNSGLSTTQGRIATGLAITSGKDNAAYFQISETMKGDSAAYSSINEGLTLTKNSVATARLGAEKFAELAGQFSERVAFAQGATGGTAEIKAELDEIVKQMETTIKQSTFNGDDMVGAAAVVAGPTPTVVADDGTMTNATEAPTTRNVVTGVSRSGAYAATTIAVDTVDLSAMYTDFAGIADTFDTHANPATGATPEAYLQEVLVASEEILGRSISAATSLGLSEKSIEDQQGFLTSLVDNIDAGVGSMVDANMEEEAARLQALQVQQQLATQALSIANSAPQSVLSLFR